MSNEEKIFAGTGTIQETKYGVMPKVTFHKDNINTIVKYMKDNKTDFITLDMKQKREVGDSKKTHYLEVSTWKPDESKGTEQAPQPQINKNEQDILPF